MQGSRTPLTDARARGALVGLTLFHGRGHIWRALLEAICLGTRAAVDSLGDVLSEKPNVLLASGGARVTRTASAGSQYEMRAWEHECKQTVLLVAAGRECAE